MQRVRWQSVAAVLVRSGEDAPPSRAPLRAAAVAAALALAAGWTCAGSLGLAGYPLRRGAGAALALAAIAVAWPSLEKSAGFLVLLAAAAAWFAWMLPQAAVPLEVWALALPLFVIAGAQRRPARILGRSAAEAVAALGLWRLAYTSIPAVWLAADGLFGAWARLAGSLAGHPLAAGATFAAADILLTSLYFLVAVALRSRPYRAADLVRRRTIWLLAAALVAHTAYLALVALAPQHWGEVPPLAAAADEAGAAPDDSPPAPDAPKSFVDSTEEPAFEEHDRWRSLAAHAGSFIPWNLPAAAALVHFVLALVAAGVLVVGSGEEAAQPPPPAPSPLARAAGPLIAATALALGYASCWYGGTATLAGKKIVMFSGGFGVGTWDKPRHGSYGQYSHGSMYSILPDLLDALGAKVLISPELSAHDLAGADAVLVIYPDDPWLPGQRERVWDYVRQGGSLLVLGEHTVDESAEHFAGETKVRPQPRYDRATELRLPVSYINELLEPTGIRVAFDSCMMGVGGWLQSYDSLAHPLTAGMGDEANEYGIVIGASLRCRLPALPLLVGRFGWNDPGRYRRLGESLMGDRRYGPGERLGDVILAAEQRLGDGRVLVLGDTSGFQNAILVHSHPFLARVLGYLASGGPPPRTLGRQLLALVLAGGLLALLWLYGRAGHWALALVALSLAVSAATTRTARDWSLVPTAWRAGAAAPSAAKRLAYIDNAHLGVGLAEAWRPQGLAGLALTLMRSGYLTLGLPELTRERLSGAALLVSVAPDREYTPAEREMLMDWVRQGGIFIITVGYDRAAPSEKLLADFGFRVGWANDPLGEPEPIGHFKFPYYSEPERDFVAFVRFHAAWPIACIDPEALKVVVAPPRQYPLILVRRCKEGLVAVIGDTYFATDQNLEREHGEPFEGKFENAHFWHWFLALLGEGQMWYPSAAPDLQPPPNEAPAETPLENPAMPDDAAAAILPPYRRTVGVSPLVQSDRRAVGVSPLVQSGRRAVGVSPLVQSDETATSRLTPVVRPAAPPEATP